MYALSRDHAFPDRGFFGKMNQRTKTPLYSVGLATFLCMFHSAFGLDDRRELTIGVSGFLPGFLGLARYAEIARKKR